MASAPTKEKESEPGDIPDSTAPPEAGARGFPPSTERRQRCRGRAAIRPTVKTYRPLCALTIAPEPPTSRRQPQPAANNNGKIAANAGNRRRREREKTALKIHKGGKPTINFFLKMRILILRFKKGTPWPQKHRAAGGDPAPLVH
jgi:hypothetical protein